MMHYLTTALAAIALVAIVIFATQNLQVVEVDFLFWSLKLSKFRPYRAAGFGVFVK